MIIPHTDIDTRFPKGSRVRRKKDSSMYPVRHSVATLGTVIGYGIRDHTIIVQRDGVKAAETYASAHWEIIPNSWMPIPPASTGEAK